MPDATTDSRTPIAVAHGDGIGPEIMEATLRILDAAEAPLRYDTVEVGENVYRAGHTSGIAPETWDTIRSHRLLLKALQQLIARKILRLVRSHELCRCHVVKLKIGGQVPLPGRCAQHAPVLKV